MQTRRGFLRMLGLGGAAIAVAPKLLKAVAVAKPKLYQYSPLRIVVQQPQSFFFSSEAGDVYEFKADGVVYRMDSHPIRYPAK